MVSGFDFPLNQSIETPNSWCSFGLSVALSQSPLRSLGSIVFESQELPVMVKRQRWISFGHFLGD